MKYKILKLLFLTSLLSFNDMFCYSQSANGDLTIQETIELAKKQYYEFVPAEDIAKSKRANPLARPFLYEIMKDTNQQKIWPQVVGSFAYLGNNEDVPKLENFLRNQSGLLNNYKFNAVMMVFDVLGAMTARKVDSSLVLQKRMFNPDYWADYRFRIYETKPDVYPEFKNYMVLKVLAGYAYAQDPDFNVVVDSIYNKISSTLTNSEEKKFIAKNVRELKMFEQELRARKTH